MSPVRQVMRQAFAENPCWLLGKFFRVCTLLKPSHACRDFHQMPNWAHPVVSGDSAYPHEPWLQKPILHAVPGTPQARYTRLHNANRNCVERTIGTLKGRFRCLLTDRTLHYAPVKAGQIVNACAVLHNFLMERNEPLLVFLVPEDLGEDEEDINLQEVGLMEQALLVRNHLIQIANDYYLNN